MKFCATLHLTTRKIKFLQSFSFQISASLSGQCWDQHKEMIMRTHEPSCEMRESAEIQKVTRYFNMSSAEGGRMRPHGRDMMAQDDDDHSW